MTESAAALPGGGGRPPAVAAPLLIEKISFHHRQCDWDRSVTRRLPFEKTCTLFGGSVALDETPRPGRRRHRRAVSPAVRAHLPKPKGSFHPAACLAHQNVL